jgi:hypothetical protein
MRFLKTLTLNRRAIYDSRVALDTNNNFTLADSTVMTLPKSSSSLPGVEGQIRYNTSTHEVEVFQGNGGSATWRNLRYKEPTAITVQTLGYGDASTIYFGTLNPEPSSPGGVSWSNAQKAKQLIVLVENVVQVAGTNYELEENPVTISGVTYTPKTTGVTAIGAFTINFDVTVPSPFTVYPSVDIDGAVVSGDSAIQSGSVIVSHTVNAGGQLTSITLDLPTTTTTIADLTQLTITDASNAGTGWYVKFLSAVPYGKPVTVLHGFDQ